MIRIALFALLLSLTAAPVLACPGGAAAGMATQSSAGEGGTPTDPNAAPAPAGEAPKSP